MGIIDTHAHLVCDELYPEVDAIIRRAKERNVIKILCICTNKIELERGLKLQEQYGDYIDLAYGLHPADLDKVSIDDLASVKQAAIHKKIIAIGEIGLDYHWNVVSKEEQANYFIKQIEIANEFNLPILIHMREATQDCLAILKKHAKTGGIMHCFSGSLETAQELMKIGFYIGIGGIVTFKNANNLLTVAQQIPSDKLMVETDCPYLAPVPYRGRRNEVAYIHATFEFLESLKATSISEQLQINYQDLFYGRD